MVVVLFHKGALLGGKLLGLLCLPGPALPPSFGLMDNGVIVTNEQMIKVQSVDHRRVVGNLWGLKLSACLLSDGWSLRTTNASSLNLVDERVGEFINKTRVNLV